MDLFVFVIKINYRIFKSRISKSSLRRVLKEGGYNSTTKRSGRKCGVAKHTHFQERVRVCGM